MCLKEKKNEKNGTNTEQMYTHWMLLIHSSFSSSVEADILYTVCFPSTTFPSLSVLHALITSLPAQKSSKQ